MKQPYIYTMPESFMKDQSVPARWRLLGLINGFHISGKVFYASNEWIMEQLSCSEQTVSNAVSELETLKEIRCERTRRSRVIHRTLRDPNELGSQPQPTRVSDPNQLGTTSDSNSDNLLVADAPILEIKEEPEDGPKKRKSKAKYDDARVAFTWLPNQEESWDRNTTELECGLLLFKRGEEAVRKFVKYVHKHRDDEGFNWRFVVPSDYERKWPIISDYAKRNS